MLLADAAVQFDGGALIGAATTIGAGVGGGLVGAAKLLVGYLAKKDAAAERTARLTRKLLRRLVREFKGLSERVEQIAPSSPTPSE